MPFIYQSSYKAPFYLPERHSQTIVPYFFRRVNPVKYQRERIETPDGDFLDLDWITPYQNKKLVILTHGLEGDSSRNYIKGMVNAFMQSGYNAMAWNLRGCSGEPNRKINMYHSGMSQDLDAVIHHILSAYDYQELILVGFSLGGNLNLKYIGEQGQDIPKQIKRSLNFSVPLDLYGSSNVINHPLNTIYEMRFLKTMKRKVKEKARAFPGKVDLTPMKHISSIKEFDDFYTGPMNGFKNMLDYYAQSSALRFLPGVAIPSLIVNAKNDPMLSSACYPKKLAREHSRVHLETPSDGGHCGFPFFQNDKFFLNWAERRAIEFIELPD